MIKERYMHKPIFGMLCGLILSCFILYTGHNYKDSSGKMIVLVMLAFLLNKVSKYLKSMNFF